jgi:hypothetical protein
VMGRGEVQNDPRYLQWQKTYLMAGGLVYGLWVEFMAGWSSLWPVGRVYGVWSGHAGCCACCHVQWGVGSEGTLTKSTTFNLNTCISLTAHPIQL